MSKNTEHGMPDNPDPHETLKHRVVKCAEKQKGYDIEARLKNAPVDLLKRMLNRDLDMMRALLCEFTL